MGTRRLQKEVLDLSENPLDWASAEPVGGDLFVWNVSVMGPSNTPYFGGIFKLKMTLSTE